MRDRSPSIVDVAREAGVSYTTVSRVINNKGNVKPETQQRVLAAMTRLGYVVDQRARSLAGGRSQVIGLLVRDLDTGYIGEIIRGIGAELATAQYELMLYTTHHRRTKESVFVTTITRGLADGLLLVLPREPEAYLETLLQHQFPYVLIDHQGVGENCALVRATNQQGGYDATRYLIELGHRRIGFITGIMHMGCAVERLAGYKAALADHDVAFDPDLVFEGNFFQPKGYAGARALLSLPEPPTAIFSSNDVSAFGVMEAVRDQGLRVPDDVSIIGFDDIPQAADVHPPLTTVRQPLEQMGRVATRLLMKYIDDPQLEARQVELSTELVIRESCQAPDVRRKARATSPGAVVAPPES